MKKEVVFLISSIFVVLIIATIFIAASGKDLNSDGVVNRTDIALLATIYRQSNATFDQNGDGVINLFDIVVVSKNISNGSNSSNDPPTPSGNIRFDTRSGGAQDIQAVGVTTLAQATTASGFNSQNAGNDGANYTPFFTTDADGAGSHAWGFPWKDYANSGNGEHDQMIYNAGMGGYGITTGETYIQWKIWHGKTSSGGGVGNVGDWKGYGDDGTSANDGAGKRIVWYRTGSSSTGRFTFTAGRHSNGECEIFYDGLSSPSPSPYPVYANTSVDWNDYASGGWVTLTLRLVPESVDGALDGIVEAWIDGVKIDSRTGYRTGALGFNGQLNLGGPTWIDPPQDQTMYLKDVVIWQP